MSTWLNPLSSEAVLGAVVGAVISTTLAYSEIFKVSDLYGLFYAVGFIFLVITFAIGIHFACASLIVRNYRVMIPSYTIVVLIVIIVALLDISVGEPNSSGHFVIGIRLENILLSSIFIMWAAALFILTMIKISLTEKEL